MAASKVNITCNVVAQFGDPVSAFAEVDDREDGFNGGKTSFSPGDRVYILMYMPDNYEVKSGTPIATAGTLTRKIAKDDRKNIIEEAQFVNVDSVNTHYPIKPAIAAKADGTPAVPSGVAVKFIPKETGPAAVSAAAVSQFTVKMSPARSVNTTTKKLEPEYRIKLAEITYDSEHVVYELSGVPNDVTSVYCFWVVGKKEGWV